MPLDSKTTGYIDVHAHYLPPGYRETATAALGGVPDGMPRMPDWDPKSTIAVMDRQGIATAMLSVSSPGVHFGDDGAARAAETAMAAVLDTLGFLSGDTRALAFVSAPVTNTRNIAVGERRPAQALAEAVRSLPMKG
jgi:hypothetical protein